MTVSPTSGAEMQQWSGDTGLDDMNMSDAVIPRIRISHADGTWKDTLTDTAYPTLYFIALGLVKQRVLFHANVEDDDVPMCKSSDFNMGYPNPEAKREKSFPWEKSNFDPADYPADPSGQAGPLPCSSCALKDWGSHPLGSNPYCSEQWTMPIYYDGSGQADGTFDVNAADWTPAILTLQKSSLRPIRSYLSSFKAGNKPPFLNVAKATLKVLQRGQVTYSVPTFTKGSESPRERWGEFAEQYGEMRSFLIQPPVRDEADGTEAKTDNSWGAQPSQPTADVPVQQPPAQPVAQQPPVQQQPPAQPVAQQPPVPPAQPVAQQPPAQPASPAQPVAQQPPVNPDPWAAPGEVAQTVPVQQTPEPVQHVTQNPPTPEQQAVPPQAAPPAQPAAPQVPAGQQLPF